MKMTTAVSVSRTHIDMILWFHLTSGSFLGSTAPVQKRCCCHFYFAAQKIGVARLWSWRGKRTLLITIDHANRLSLAGTSTMPLHKEE
jgi:hypothetical protein